MSTTFKTILVLVAVAATVFGLTVIAQYTRTPAARATVSSNPNDEAPSEIVQYDMRQMRLDAGSQYVAHRMFPGYFEIGENIYVVFWVSNPNTFPVKVATKGRSCTSCTEAALAVIEPGGSITDYVAKDYLAPTAAMFGGVALASPDQFNAEAWSNAASKLPPDRWQALNFDKPDAMLTIPAADPERGPTWAAIRVRVVAKEGAHIERGISADLAFHSEHSKFPQQTKFVVEYVGVPPFNIIPKDLKFGDMSPGTERKSIDIIYFSSTQVGLPLPLLAADGKDPFLTFDKPEKLGEADQRQLIASQGGAQAGVRILAAYKVAVALNRKAAGRELDIGPLEKTFTVTASGGTGASHSVQGTIKAVVQGIVSLDGGQTLTDLGDFNGRSGITKQATLVSEDLNLQLEPVPAEHVPSYLQVTLSPPRNEGTRRLWTVTIQIDPNVGLGNLPANSALVFKVGTTGQILRIPVKGHGKLSAR